MHLCRHKRNDILVWEVTVRSAGTICCQQTWSLMSSALKDCLRPCRCHCPTWEGWTRCKNLRVWSVERRTSSTERRPKSPSAVTEEVPKRQVKAILTTSYSLGWINWKEINIWKVITTVDITIVRRHCLTSDLLSSSAPSRSPVSRSTKKISTWRPRNSYCKCGVNAPRIVLCLDHTFLVDH